MLSLRVTTLFFAGTLATLIAPDLNAADTCPVTHEPTPEFVPSGLAHVYETAHGFYYGTKKLWVFVEISPWRGLPLWDIGYRNKIAWWSEGYDWKADPAPTLAISGKRLDGSAPALVVSGTNGSYTGDLGAFIMSGVNFPTAGCWEITGKFKGAEVKFVVSVKATPGEPILVSRK